MKGKAQGKEGNQEPQVGEGVQQLAVDSSYWELVLGLSPPLPSSLQKALESTG